MPHKHRSSKVTENKKTMDLTLVKFLVTNKQKISHSPGVDRILD